MNEPSRPFDGLSPDVVLESVERLGIACDGHLLALNSFENRVYQIGVDDAEHVIAKFYRPARWSDEAILEEHRFSLDLAEREIPVVAPTRDADGATLHEHAGFRYALYPSRGGYWPELEAGEDRRQLGRFIGRIHAFGAVETFLHRPGIDVESYGERSMRYLLDTDLVPPESEGAYREVAAAVIEAASAAFERAAPLRRIRLHGDLHRGNILWSQAGPHIVDLDDCRNGPAVQDLWMLLAGDREQTSLQIADLLEGYRTFFEFDARELVVVEALRALRMMHHAAWIARRWVDPAFPIAFPWFGSRSYWEGYVADLRDQLGRIDEPPLYA